MVFKQAERNITIPDPPQYAERTPDRIWTQWSNNESDTTFYFNGLTAGKVYSIDVRCVAYLIGDRPNVRVLVDGTALDGTVGAGKDYYVGYGRTYDSSYNTSSTFRKVAGRLYFTASGSNLRVLFICRNDETGASQTARFYRFGSTNRTMEATLTELNHTEMTTAFT